MYTPFPDLTKTALLRAIGESVAFLQRPEFDVGETYYEKAKRLFKDRLTRARKLVKVNNASAATPQRQTQQQCDTKDTLKNVSSLTESHCSPFFSVIGD